MQLYDIRTTCRAKPEDEPTVGVVTGVPHKNGEFSLMCATVDLLGRATLLLRDVRRVDGWLTYDADELTKIEVRPSA